MAIHQIDLDRVELNIFPDCVDKIWMGVKPEKLMKVQHSTVYRTDKSEEDKEEVEGAVLGDGGDEFSIVPFVYPCGTVSVSSLDFFSLLVFLLNLLILIFLYLLEQATLKSTSRRRWGGNDNPLSHSSKRPIMRSG